MKKLNEIRIKDLTKIYYNHQYLYKSLHVVLSNGHKRITLNLWDNYDRNFGINSLNKALIQLNRKFKYFHLREYKNSGFAACLSNKYDDPYVSNERYKQITIPMDEYNTDDISNLLIDMMMARLHYSNYRMTSAKVDGNNNIILNSKKLELIISNWDTHIILPTFDEEHDRMYQLSEDRCVKGWYVVTPLSLVNTNEDNMKSIIMTRKELEDNIINLIEYSKNNHIA